jgi:hypothetical protein
MRYRLTTTRQYADSLACEELFKKIRRQPRRSEVSLIRMCSRRTRCEVFSRHLDIPAAGWGCPFRTYQFLFAPKIKISRSVLLLSRGFVTRVAIAVPCHRCLRKATQMEVLRFPVGFRRDLTWLRPVTHRTSTSVGRCPYRHPAAN